MQKIKSLAAVFLALFILAAIPTQALAAEAHVCLLYTSIRNAARRAKEVTPAAPE